MRDSNVWRELPPMADGFVPAVPRRWMFIGRRHGEQCRFECRLESKHSSVPLTYAATAVFAHNVHYLCHDWVRMNELEAIE